MRMTQKNAVSFLLTLIVVAQPFTARAAQTAPTTAVEAISAIFTAPSADSVDGEDPADTQAPQTVQQILLDVCTGHGYGEDCAKLLFGMMWQESNNRYNVQGDYSRAKGEYLALGYFQIHYKMHKVSADCATDLACSAEWTLKYMESNAYPKYPMYAVQCHNGCNINNGYNTKVVRHAAALWDKPMYASQPTTNVVQVASK